MSLTRRRQLAKHDAEHGVTPRRLCERAGIREERRDAGLSPGRVDAVDEVAERIEREMLRDRHPECELPRADRQPRARLVEGEAERGTVGDMDREASRSPARPACHALPEHRDVGVVAAEDALVERLLCRPSSSCYGTGCR